MFGFPVNAFKWVAETSIFVHICCRIFFFCQIIGVAVRAAKCKDGAQQFYDLHGNELLPMNTQRSRDH